MKTAFVTGGSRGIGAEIVRALCRDGYKVAFTYKSSLKEAQALERECGAIAIMADSANRADVAAAAKEAEEKLGGVGLLVNNAAVSSFSLLTDISDEEWDNTLAVNLTAPFLYCRALIPGMVSRKEGRIINISSVWGLVGSSCEAHYSATKAALIGLTKALAKELGPSGITVNAIAPGVINTAMNAALDEQAMAELTDGTPLMRIGEPSEVARAVLFLAGEGGSFITGETLNISGGFVI